MHLNPPTFIIFVASLLLTLLAVLAVFLAIPMLSPYALWMLLGGYVLLAIGCLVPGL
ncbi:tryptophan-rich sensory protein [Rhodoligotrophos appendicifer]|uniref:hypothetical protein n=1 Tax=Rhodoligotrophos appendicifer TaxID=987056 RepID=UPI001479505F|nr:hypothetical protein [Rhodoligotrophos appendicifer]